MSSSMTEVPEQFEIRRFDIPKEHTDSVQSTGAYIASVVKAELIPLYAHKNAIDEHAEVHPDCMVEQGRAKANFKIAEKTQELIRRGESRWQEETWEATLYLSPIDKQEVASTQ